jgi:hypothetical protein
LTFIGGRVREVRGMAVKLANDCSRRERTVTFDPIWTVGAHGARVSNAAMD